MRVKKIGPIKAKVYAAALYVDKADVVANCKDIKALDASSLAKSNVFEDAFVKTSSEKNIVLKMARTVGADTMISALAESVKPRLKQVSSAAALAKFESILQDGLKNGGAKTNMQFSFRTTGNNMIVCIDGQDKGAVPSADLCQVRINH